ncbi:hypothetical protein [Planktothrix paucivesiculata]|uniref:Uncharacterized protein n=1 Tax=Planktothrix paucivesiculata PCC 9631 TaxID=671071 RepID=A0A7Z9E3X0_9CYAN|nr:hypothetical protein [Planktothrix paucivesiculata]VXD24196.1 conserved exported hypothetical protein [Planktothrix paucivesiculata PCC 9631]
MLKQFLIGSVLIASTLFRGEAQASIITYDFTVNVRAGALTGKSFNGTFSYDDSSLTGSGVEELGVNQGLTVCMNFFGRNYNETEDSSYPMLPKLVFENGLIKQLDFWIEPNKRLNWWNESGWEVTLSPSKNSASSNCKN